MNTSDPTDNIVALHSAHRNEPDVTVQLELFPAGGAQPAGFSARVAAPLRLTRPSEGTSPSELVPPAARAQHA